MALTLLKKQLKALDMLAEHESQITRDFSSLSQRRAQLITQRTNAQADPDFDAGDIQQIQNLIDLIDSKFSEIQL